MSSIFGMSPVETGIIAGMFGGMVIDNAALIWSQRELSPCDQKTFSAAFLLIGAGIALTGVLLSREEITALGNSILFPFLLDFLARMHIQQQNEGNLNVN